MPQILTVSDVLNVKVENAILKEKIADIVAVPQELYALILQ